jgi:hypothetical protein
MNAHRVEATLTRDGILTLSNLPFHAGDTVEVLVLERPAKSALVAEKEKIPQKPRALKRPRTKTTPFTLKGSLELGCSPEELEEEMQHIRSTWTEAAQQSSVELAGDLARK